MHENSYGQLDWRDFKADQQNAWITATVRGDLCWFKGDCTFRVVVKRTRYLAQSVAHRLASSSASTGWYQSGLFTCVLSR